jgi:hypothetical protein
MLLMHRGGREYCARLFTILRGEPCCNSMLHVMYRFRPGQGLYHTLYNAMVGADMGTR